MNIKEYEDREVKRKDFEYTISKALGTLFDRHELCCERGNESDSVQRAIIINFLVNSLKGVIGVKRMNSNGPLTQEIYRKYIEEALNLLEDAVRELYKIDENQKW